MKKVVLLLLAVSILVISCAGCSGGNNEDEPIGMAVEFMDHAASAYISNAKGWYVDEGLSLTTYESYATGMTLAAALARDDIQVAYMCLIPAINAYANSQVPLKIVAGTHKYGYGLVVNPDKIANVTDLQNEGITIGCVREGGAVDVVMHKTIDAYGLDEDTVVGKVQRMNPQKLALSIQMGQLDAAFMPEHWASMAEECGFQMLLTAQDIWPDMQGSVLVVKESLLTDSPDIVEKLVRVSQKSTDWINDEPQDSADVMTAQLNSVGIDLLPVEIADVVAKLEINSEVMLRSMNRLDFTTEIDVQEIQDTIDYLVELGYISSSFNAEDILDLSFLE